MTRRNHMPSRATAGSTLLLLFLLLSPQPASAQNVQGSVHYLNNTGEPRNDLEIEYNQNISNLNPNPVPPFTQTTPLNNKKWRLEGGSIANGGRVPTAPGEMTWTGGGRPGETMHIVCGTWTLDGIAKNNVSRVVCKNRTGKPATDLHINIADGNDNALTVMHTDMGVINANGKTVDIVGISVPNNGDFGPVQLTRSDAMCPKKVACMWTDADKKIGSTWGELVNNDTGRPATGLTVRTNIPVTQLEPPVITPFTSVTGLGTNELIFSGGIVLPGEGLLDELIIVTSDDEGPIDIRITSISWAASVISIPTLSSFGLVILLVVLASGGAIFIRFRRLTITS